MEIKEYRLGDFCIVKNGNKNKEDQVIDGKYNFYVRSKNILKSNDYSIDGKYIIIPGEGIFYPIWNDGKASIHQRVYYIKTNEKICKTKYLYYWYIKNNFILYQNAVGTTVKSLRLRNFIEPKIKLPNLEVQQEIINIIEPFEKIEVLLCQWIKKIGKISSLVFLKINSKYSVSNLADVSAGQSPPQISKYWNNGYVPFININNLTNNFYVLNSKVFLNELGLKKYRCKLTSNWSILVGKVSPDKNKISLINSGFVANGAIRIVEVKEKKNYAQLFYSLRESGHILSRMAVGSVQKQINSSQLLNLKIKFDSEFNDIFNKLLSAQKLYWKIINLVNKIKTLLIEYYL